MGLQDPVADMLIRIKNACNAKHDDVVIPHSKYKEEIIKIMKKEGYIKDYIVEGSLKKVIRVYLKYGPKGESVIRDIVRISKPGCRKYRGYAKLPRVCSGLGVAILTTSQGVLSDRDARKRKIGGEVICYIW